MQSGSWLSAIKARSLRLSLPAFGAYSEQVQLDLIYALLQK
ncbi:tetratricopeptide repeat protein [Vibrio lentus]|nr:tetratricopeptide repeat protein [Vibrio lentus]